MNCDHRGCPDPATYECYCRRCREDAPDGAYHSCTLHAREDASIRAHHQRVFPNHPMDLRRFEPEGT